MFKRLGELGLLGLTKPEKYGGMALDYSYSVAMAEALGHVDCGGVPMAIGVQTDMCTPALARFGSEELRARVPGAGDRRRRGRLHRRLASPAPAPTWRASRATRARTATTTSSTAQKMWITNSLQADWMCLLANTGEGRGAQEQEPDHGADEQPRASIKAKKIRKIGMMSSDTGLIYFDDVRVPQRNRIGEEGMGFIYQMQQFQEERLWAAASALAVAARTASS